MMENGTAAIMRRLKMANQPRCSSRRLMFSTAGCVRRGSTQSLSSVRTMRSEMTALTVVAVSAMRIPRAVPKRMPADTVIRVRGIGNWVIRTYSSQNRTGNQAPVSSDQVRRVDSGGTSRSIHAATNNAPATKSNGFTEVIFGKGFPIRFDIQLSGFATPR